MLKISRFLATSVGVLCLSLLAGQGQAQPSYEESMARQREQERQIMEQGQQMAAWEADEDQGEDDEDGGGNGSPFFSAPPYAWHNFIADNAKMVREEHDRRMASDPIYRDLYHGIWTFRRTEPGDPHPACIATFWTLKGGVTMIHWGGADNITMLGFFGGIIPKPEKPQIVMLDLTQSGEKQSVRAINMTFGAADKLGMYVFLVPSAQALLNSIEDVQDFQIDFKGVTAAQGSWHSGLKARAELGKCIAGKL